jgi:hypothetical protein
MFAITFSKETSKSPENRHTSVEVPPMSKPITGLDRESLYAVKAQPTKPPAGPERTARRPENLDGQDSLRFGRLTFQQRQVLHHSS